jgi:hypothetical protein
MEVPAGFCQLSTHNKNLLECLSMNSLLVDSHSRNITSAADPLIEVPDVSIDLDQPLNTNLSSQSIIPPIIRLVDKPSSSLLKTITMTEDFIRASLGLRRIDTLKHHSSDLYKDSVKIDSLPPDANLDPGDLASLQKTPRNTTPVPRSSNFGEVIHVDIVFGPEVAIGNIHYGLLFTDHFSRMNYLYPLQNLTSDIKKQVEAFFAHIGTLPHHLISNVDLKLIGGKAREYLNSLLIHVNVAPAYRQGRNGLAERHWQTMVMMAGNWLASAELPSTFWFHVVKRAAEVCNYVPFKLENGQFTTPFELAHQKKPDLRVSFKLFGLAAVCHERVSDTQISTFDSQSLLMIAIGRCLNSNGLPFYNPENGTFVSSFDYHFQNHKTSGAHFGYI